VGARVLVDGSAGVCGVVGTAGGAADLVAGVAAVADVPLVAVGGGAARGDHTQGVALAAVDGGTGRLGADPQCRLDGDRGRAAAEGRQSVVSVGGVGGGGCG